jgi:hypothetical protein
LRIQQIIAEEDLSEEHPRADIHANRADVPS